MNRTAGLICLALMLGSQGCSGDDDAGDASRGGRGGSGNAGDGSGGDGTAGDGTAGDGSGGITGPMVDGGMVSQPTDPGNPTGILDGGFVIPDELLLCNGVACQCADGMDNDGDGVADGFDVECTGPADDDEGTFATGISGDNRDPFWQDCFFDGNSGAGNDGCRYHTECLTGEREQTDDSCMVSDECIRYCGDRTPNGCDCFGCCTVTRSDGSEVDIIIGTNCDADDLSSCITCTKTMACGNECGECELCPGRTIADLPDSCRPPPPGGSGGSGGSEAGSGGAGSGAGSGGSEAGSGGTGGTAGGGVPVDCGTRPTCLSQADCPGGYYCYLACCLLIPVD
jgi:hypothetical protein